MPFNTNIKEFSGKAPSHLVESYRILVTLELALKDGNFLGGAGGHDVPAMLSQVSQTVNVGTIPGELNSLSGALANALRAITCQGTTGIPEAVPRHSYPYIRYCRFKGDWGGLQETPTSNIADLYSICNQTYWFLKTHKNKIGINL